MSFFGINIKKIRKLKSLSQKDFGDLFNLKRATLGAYEEGRSEPKIETIINFANYFSISIDDLLKRELSINELLKFNTDLTTDESQLRKSYPQIPIITKECISDYIKYYNKSTFIENMPFVVWPLADDKKDFRAYQIQDLEMSNNEGGLYPGDIIVLEKVDLNFEFNNQLSLIVFEDIKLRRITKESETRLKLKADHPAIEDEFLKTNNINEIWNVVGVYQKFRNIEIQQKYSTSS